VENRWLDPYVPESGFPPAATSVRRSRSRRRGPGSERTLWQRWKFPLVTGIVSSLLASFAIFFGGEFGARMRNWLIDPRSAARVIVNPRLEPLIGLKVERSQHRAVLSTLVPSELKPLEEFWSDEGGTEHIGMPPAGAPMFYAPVPRRDPMQPYADLVTAGIGTPRLYIVYVPADWTSVELRMHLNHWAAECSVERDWIVTWSRFPEDPALGSYEDFCAPGRRCLIISHGCKRAFEDLK
jgi:hypothetical protein